MHIIPVLMEGKFGSKSNWVGADLGACSICISNVALDKLTPFKLLMINNTNMLFERDASPMVVS